MRRVFIDFYSARIGGLRERNAWESFTSGAKARFIFERIMLGLKPQPTSVPALKRGANARCADGVIGVGD